VRWPGLDTAGQRLCQGTLPLPGAAEWGLLPRWWSDDASGALELEMECTTQGGAEHLERLAHRPFCSADHHGRCRVIDPPVKPMLDFPSVLLAIVPVVNVRRVRVLHAAHA
jgi:hypothetical protein